jgi:predicted protein tyrosine phosphatase
MTSTFALPCICSLAEAEVSGSSFAHVVSLVPSTSALLNSHPSRVCVPFADVFFPQQPQAPTPADIEQLLAFAPSPRDGLLIHCHAGVSRSTATALGLLAAWGVDPAEAYTALHDAHPPGRLFAPNPLVLTLFDNALGLGGALYETGTRWLR